MVRAGHCLGQSASRSQGRSGRVSGIHNSAHTPHDPDTTPDTHCIYIHSHIYLHGTSPPLYQVHCANISTHPQSHRVRRTQTVCCRTCTLAAPPSKAVVVRAGHSLGQSASRSQGRSGRLSGRHTTATPSTTDPQTRSYMSCHHELHGTSPLYQVHCANISTHPQSHRARRTQTVRCRTCTHPPQSHHLPFLGTSSQYYNYNYGFNWKTIQLRCTITIMGIKFFNLARVLRHP